MSNQNFKPDFKTEAVRRIAQGSYSVADASISMTTYTLSSSTLVLKNSKSSVLLNGNRSPSAEFSMPR